jgi:hypothetical protein
VRLLFQQHLVIAAIRLVPLQIIYLPSITLSYVMLEIKAMMELLIKQTHL